MKHIAEFFCRVIVLHCIVKFYPVPVALVSGKWNRAVIVVTAGRSDGAGNNINLLLFFNFSFMECECLLYDHAIRIASCSFATKAEIAKAVADVFSVVFFNALEHMWVVSDYKVWPSSMASVPEPLVLSGVYCFSIPQWKFTMII